MQKALFIRSTLEKEQEKEENMSKKIVGPYQDRTGDLFRVREAW